MYGQTNGIQGVDIVESGSNENGNWIKYADGTMICWATPVVTVAISNAWGAWFESPAFTWAFPQEFVVAPCFFATRLTGYGAVLEFSGGVTTTVSPTVSLVRPTAIGENNYRMAYMAIGKWR